MKFNSLVSIPVAALVVMTTSYPVKADTEDSVRTVQKANTVLQSFVSSDRIPTSILRQSRGIAIIPRLVQAGFILGGQRGEGIMLVRNQDGTWSNPAIITITSGSIGAQIGARSSEVVLVFQDDESIRKLYSGPFELGATIAGTAGSRGTEPQFPTDSSGNVYSYVKSEGLFAGVALSGLKVAFDDDETAQLYGDNKLTARQVFTSQDLTAPTAVNDLKRTLQEVASQR